MMAHRSIWRLGAAGVIGAMLIAASPAHAADAAKNLLRNGWHSQAWIEKGQPVQFHQTVLSIGDPAQVEISIGIDAAQPNAARFTEPITVDPGWYEIGADVRTEAIGANGYGASLTVSPGIIIRSPRFAAPPIGSASRCTSRSTARSARISRSLY